MPGFAERMGLRAARTLVQSQSLDAETRTELWNVATVIKDVFEEVARRASSTAASRQVLSAVWRWEFKQPADEQPYDSHVWTRIKRTILDADWADALDLIESLVGYVERYEDVHTRDLAATIVDAYNNRFEHYLVGFRFIDGEITPIDSTAEAEAVSDALEDASVVAGARHHLERAVELLADRAAPDYPNSIKESISAVEAIVKKVTGESTLGAGLKKLEANGLTLHLALKGAWEKMYGWASDEDGIRHGGIDAAEADQALAKYVLVTCSAFVSYLTEQGRKAGLL